MRRALRLGLGALGLAAAVFGAASLTGGWLGMPPWWQQHYLAVRQSLYSDGRCVRSEVADTCLNEGREEISGAVIAAGLGLAAFGAWPRRAPAAPL